MRVLLVLLLLTIPALAQDGFQTIAVGVESQERVPLDSRVLPVRLGPGIASGAPLRAWLDGAEVPILCARRGQGCGIWLPEDLAPGEHSVRVRVPLAKGGYRDVSWDIVAMAPTPADAKVTVETNATDRVVYERGILVVTARGPRGGEATAYVANRSFPLREVSPGVYQGAYEVVRGDNLMKQPVVVRVLLPRGHMAAGQAVQPVSLLGQFYTVDIITPEVGATVPWEFWIKGRTRPGAEVQIQPSNGRPSWHGTEIGAYPPQLESIAPNEARDDRTDDSLGSMAVQADERGYFETRFHLGPRILKPSTLTFYVGAIDKGTGEMAIGSTFSVRIKD